jgi:hypothetical protein
LRRAAAAGSPLRDRLRLAHDPVGATLVRVAAMKTAGFVNIRYGCSAVAFRDGFARHGYS